MNEAEDEAILLSLTSARRHTPFLYNLKRVSLQAAGQTVSSELS